MEREYIENMRAHVDLGGQLSHTNGCELLAEVERLQGELERAYRALNEYCRAHSRRVPLGIAELYHTPTVAAAYRFLETKSLDGAGYFEGKPVEEMHRWLAAGQHVFTPRPESAIKTDNPEQP